MPVLDQIRGELVTGVRIFRAGKFRDRTWTTEDLEAMVSNFELLRESNIFPNVPVRADHGRTVSNVVGYLHNLRVEDAFLVADIEFTEPEGKARWDRGTFRNRSVEVGSYVDNHGKKHNPVVWGMAFVDIPQVEGLSKDDSGVAESFSYETRNEETMSNPDPETPDPAVPDPMPNTPETPESPPPDPEQEPEQPDPEQEPEAVATHANQDVTELHTFRLDGSDTTDFAAVQAHINELESYRTDAIRSSRESFVQGLADANIITNPQAVKFKALVLTMSNDQFDQWQAAYDGLAPASLFAKHPIDTVGSVNGAKEKGEARQLLEETVAHMKRSGFSDEQIETSPSVTKLRKDAGEDKE